MNIFLQAVASSAIIFLFDDEATIKDSFTFSLLGQESSQLLGLLETFLQKNHFVFADISHIVVVNGPGSFTGIRSIVLIVNTLAFVYEKLTLTPLSYFDLFSTFPKVKQSSKRDIFIQKAKETSIEILSNEDLILYIQKNNLKKVYGELNFPIGDIALENTPDYATICKNLRLQNHKRIEALYIKKPNIS